MNNRLASCILIGLLTLPVLWGCGSSKQSVHPDATPQDSAATTTHWQLARQYHQDMRLELARQEYLLALASCRSTQTQQRLQRELQIVDMQLRTMR